MIAFSTNKNILFISTRKLHRKNGFTKVFKNLDTDLKIILFGPSK